MGILNRILIGRKIDAWASDHTLIAARTLNQVAADLIVEVEAEVAKASLKEGLIAQTAFIQKRIAPRLREVAEPVAQMILAEANAALLELVEGQAIWVRGPEHAGQAGAALDGVRDVAVAAVPLAAGAATVAALPFAAVTTTTAWFGLVTTTAISWPVVVGGGAFAGLLLATGVINTAKIRDRTQGRLRESVRGYIVTSLIEGGGQGMSILHQLALEFERAAKRAKDL